MLDAIFVAYFQGWIKIWLKAALKQVNKQCYLRRTLGVCRWPTAPSLHRAIISIYLIDQFASFLLPEEARTRVAGERRGGQTSLRRRDSFE